METLEILKAKDNARDLDSIMWWRRLMPYLTPIGVTYHNGEPRRYYKSKIGDYYYRRISESEMYKNC